MTEYEVRLYTLFHQNNCSVDKAPYPIRDFCQNANHEIVTCIRKNDVVRALSAIRGVNPNFIELTLYRKERGLVENFNSYVQLIGAACIHDDTRFVALKLNRDGRGEGQLKGSLSYPQGHANVDAKLTSTNLTVLTDEMRKETLREIMEEIKIEDLITQGQFASDVRDRLMNYAKPYYLYIDIPGTPSGHLCFTFDIDMTGTCFDKVLDQIVSNEPEKHSVEIVDYQALLNLDRVEKMCPWMRKSFSMIPFFQSSFIKDYMNSFSSTAF